MKPLQTRETESRRLTTLAFYESQSERYARSTAHVDMEALYGPFLRELPRGGSILDAGCGSGRDTKAFAERGYRVTAIDASPTLVRRAAAFTEQQCKVLVFQDLAFRDEYDGIWACASLLHVPKRDVPDVLNRFTQALKPGGVLYISLKEGQGERTEEDGRFFNYYTADAFREVITGVATLRELPFCPTEEIRGCLNRGPWLNILLRRLG
jgi:2-polyprenyl-3-methyl-5-hydroxy-6-metoxy-1,4-benzoquinol methylase